MSKIHINIAEHIFEIVSKSDLVTNFFKHNFIPAEENAIQSDVKIEVIDTYGFPFVDYKVSITKEREKILFYRSDYLIEASSDYKSACIFVNNELALKHALMNLYSSFIVYHNWGLLIHSSCAIENGAAHIFAGQSGAGKSTAARLSYPRELLSDEATIIKINSGEIRVFNSPFRSEIHSSDGQEFVPLESIQLLYHSKKNKLVKMRKSDALVDLIDKVFYWAHCPEETKKVMSLLRILIDKVPVNELYFKKDDSFWELIS